MIQFNRNTFLSSSWIMRTHCASSPQCPFMLPNSYFPSHIVMTLKRSLLSSPQLEPTFINITSTDLRLKASENHFPTKTRTCRRCESTRRHAGIHIDVAAFSSKKQIITSHGTHTNQPLKSAIIHFTSGGPAAIFVRTSLQPLDTCKSRLQAARSVYVSGTTQ